MNKLWLLLLPAFFLTGCFHQSGDDLIPRSEAEKMVAEVTQQCVESLEEARGMARDAKRISDIRALQTAAELFFAENGKYPVIKTNVAVKSNESEWSKLMQMMYFTNPKAYPIDPQNPDKYYQYTSDGKKFTITAVFENENYGCEPIRDGLCKFEVVSDSTL